MLSSAEVSLWLASTHEVPEAESYKGDVLYFKHILQKIVVSLIVMPFILVWYKNGYWLCKGQERQWARLVTCTWLLMFSLQQCH
jgi:hypothetical protein